MRHLRPALNVSQANVADNRAARVHLCLDTNWWDPATTSLVISAHLGVFQKPAALKVASPLLFIYLFSVTQCLTTRKIIVFLIYIYLPKSWQSLPYIQRPMTLGVCGF